MRTNGSISTLKFFGHNHVGSILNGNFLYFWNTFVLPYEIILFISTYAINISYLIDVQVNAKYPCDITS
jgi:hypothetical protein